MVAACQRGQITVLNRQTQPSIIKTTMPYREPFLNFIQDDAWSNAQKESLMDLMVWTMYVDRSIHADENERLDELVYAMANAEQSPLPISQYLNEAIAKIRDVWANDQKSEAALREITLYLDSAESRETAYDLCQKIAAADGALVEAESAFLARLKEALKG